MPAVIFGVQVDPGRLDRGVAKVLLDKADIGAGVSLMRSRRVAPMSLGT